MLATQFLFDFIQRKCKVSFVFLITIYPVPVLKFKISVHIDGDIAFAMNYFDGLCCFLVCSVRGQIWFGSWKWCLFPQPIFFCSLGELGVSRAGDDGLWPIVFWPTDFQWRQWFLIYSYNCTIESHRDHNNAAYLLADGDLCQKHLVEFCMEECEGFRVNKPLWQEFCT